MLRLLVNGSQLPNVPVLTVVPAAPVSIAWASSTLSSHGLSVPVGEEAHVELACLDSYGNRISNATQGVAAQIRHDGGEGKPIVRSKTPSLVNESPKLNEACTGHFERNQCLCTC